MIDPPIPAADSHVPVLAAALVSALDPADGKVFVDATFGRGGHTRALLSAARCQVLALDRDPDAIAAGRALGEAADGRLHLVCDRFGRLAERVAEAGLGPVDGVAFDLGVSSPQLDRPERGFSFRADGPLDMRMGADGPTAADLVNGLPVEALAQIFADYGEERHARRLARVVVERRAERPLTTTADLASLVRRVVPAARDGLDPATRAFQGLRIAVNDELGEIDRGLAAAERVLRPGGRLAVIAFQSLEDRRVKQFLAVRAGRAPGPSRHAPAAPGAAPEPSFRLITRRPITPDAAECAANPRARSARLRVAERTEAPPEDGWERAA